MFSVESQGAVDVIVPHVPLKSEHVSEFQETVEHGLTKGQPMVVLNMHHVPLIDSDGLESLLDVHDVLALRGGSMKLAALSPLCRDILRVTGVAEHFETYTDVKTAVRSFVQ